MSFSRICGSEDVESSCLKIDLNNTDIGAYSSVLCVYVCACVYALCSELHDSTIHHLTILLRENYNSLSLQLYQPDNNKGITTPSKLRNKDLLG